VLRAVRRSNRSGRSIAPLRSSRFAAVYLVVLVFEHEPRNRAPDAKC
jgi:hypothetical protein